MKTISGEAFSRGSITLPIKIGRITKTIKFYVIKSDYFRYQILLGLDAIKEFKLVQDEKLKISQKQDKDYVQINNINKEQLVNTKMQESLQKIVKKNEDCFAKDKFDVGRVTSAQAQVKLTEDKFVARRPYRCSPQDRQEIENQIRRLLDADLIEESSSPYAAPVTLAQKKGEKRKTRLCVDYSLLNKIVVPEIHPFPRPEDIIEKTVNCKVFSVLDINSAFWSIPIRDEDKEKLAFVTEDNHFQWNVLPFGFKNSPAIFQRTLTNTIRRSSLNSFALNYMDDIIVFSKSNEEHLEHVKALLTAMKVAGFKLNLAKCDFAKQSVKYLGHVISHNQVKPLYDSLQAVREFPQPKNKKQVRQFLGKVNYYHKFIDNCATRLEPLHHLLRKNVEFTWSEDCAKAFNDMKDFLCSEPILQIFDHQKHIYLETDASKIGIAAVMKQVNEEGELHPVGYFSKKLLPSQAKRAAIYIECLAIKEAINFWQHLLMGREFTVITDHKPLENLKVKARPDTPLGDLMIFLLQFNFKIVYREGKSNLEADALSRNPVLEEFENEEILRTCNLLSIEDIVRDQQRNLKNFKLQPNEKVMTRSKKDKKKIILSENLGRQLIRDMHHEFGHVGSKALLGMITPFYTFSKLHEHVLSLCTSCDVCLKNKTRITKPLGFLDKLVEPDMPYQMMSLDTVGGFSKNNSPKKYLHILTDHFSKYVWIETSSTQCAKDFISLIKRVSHNRIGILLFDQYTGINSREFRKFLKDNNIEFRCTPRDHPSSNGAVERVGQTLVNRLRCKFNENDHSRSWASMAEECVQEYNSTYHSVTKFAPQYLLDGSKPDWCPIDLLEADLTTDRQKAKENTRHYFELNKQRVDKKFKDNEVDVGDWVLVDAGNKLNRNKLDEIRQGPYQIIEQVSPLMFRLDIGRRRGDVNVFHKSQLTPFHFSSGNSV